GKNNGYFRFSNVKNDTGAIDDETGEGITLVECTSDIRADVLIDGGLQSGGDKMQGALLKLKPKCVVTLRNYRCMGGGSTIEGEGGTVIMENCRSFSRTRSFAEDVKGGVTLIQRGCLDYDGNPFPEPTYMTQAEVDAAIKAA